MSADRVTGGGLIEQTLSGWRIHCGDQTRELSASIDQADLVDTFTEQLRASGEPPRCVLALAAPECFYTTFGSNDAAIGKDRTATLYELERHFPLDAEGMVVDFWKSPVDLPDGSGNRICAVAVDQQRMQALVDAVEDSHIELVAIVPKDFMIAQALSNADGSPPRLDLLLGKDSTWDYLEIRQGALVTWKHWSEAGDRLGQQLRLIRSEHLKDQSSSDPPLHVVSEDESAETRDAIESTGKTQWHTESQTGLLIQSANRVLAGRWGSLVNLRRGAFAPRDPLIAVAKPLRRLTLAASLCAAVLLAASWFRTSKIETAVQTVLEEQRSAFRDAFPDRRVPSLLLRSVRTEHRRTLGSRGRGTVVDLPTPATAVMADLLHGLANARQQGARFRLLDCAIEDGECSVTLRTREAGQIGVIAKSLEGAGFRVGPPATQQIPSSRDEPVLTFQSTLSIKWTGQPEGSRDASSSGDST